MLQIQNVSYSVQATPWSPRLPILDNISFQVNEGKAFGLLGPNGAGKTTLMKCMVGLTRPHRGIIRIMDNDPLNPASRRSLGYLPEHTTLYPYLRGTELLTLTASLYQLPRHLHQTRAEEVLTLVKLNGQGDKLLRHYSKGMLQRISLAQALIAKPKLLLLDEPLDGLDPVGRYEMKSILVTLKKEGTTLLLNSHILADVESLCDDIGIIDRGILKYTGSVRDALSQSPSLEEFFVKTICTP